MIETLFIILMAFLNRCRGSGFYGYLEYNERISATVLMIFCCALYLQNWLTFFCWPFLFFWCVFGWGKYFSAATGHVNVNEKEFAPVDWAMKKLGISTRDGIDAKIWGTIAMALRHSLILPFIIAIALIGGDFERIYWALLFPLMGVSYFVGGLISQKRCIEIAEYLCGAIIAIMVIGVS